jgi:hypothetical protein
MPDHRLTRDRRRALEVLADSPAGVTEATMLAHGFTVELLTELVVAGLASATPERVQIDRRSIRVTRVKITAAGRQALARSFY